MLDAAVYFFLNSGIFIGITAGLFFFLGLWFGCLLWGRYKALLREAEAEIESCHTEISSLKRRMVEQPTRPVMTFAHSAPLALVQPPIARGPFFPVSRAFYIWGDADGELPRIKPQPLSASNAFSLWTQPDWKPNPAILFQESRAMTLWTQPDWKPRAVPVPTPPVSRGFTLWTQPDWKPVPRSLCLPARAFTLWTEPRWMPLPMRGETPFSSNAYTLWTGPDFDPQKRILFTDSTAFSLWTEETWTPQVVRCVTPQSHAFCIWTEKNWRSSKLPNTKSSADVTGAADAGGSIFTRAISVAKNIFVRAVPGPASFAAATTRLEPAPAAPSTPLEVAPVSAVPSPESSDTIMSAKHFLPDIVGGMALLDRQLGIVYTARPDAVDDLTVLKGVGDVIEKQLNGMGVFTLKQIALWTESQAREISNRLAFKDRVLREHWREQARKLHFKKYGEQL